MGEGAFAMALPPAALRAGAAGSAAAAEAIGRSAPAVSETGGVAATAVAAGLARASEASVGETAAGDASWSGAPARMQPATPAEPPAQAERRTARGRNLRIAEPPLGWAPLKRPRAG